MSYYVILTGSKNNAGDYLIKFRAKQLFDKERPDREIIDMNGWEFLDEEKLKIVNNAKALILMGGPALQYDMWPGVYRLTDDLNDIKVPVIMMGVGWHSKQGEWENTYTYPLSHKTLELLNKVENSGYLSSVRDYHTLNTLWAYSLTNILMTGCPAYYDYNHIGKNIVNSEINKVVFSLGVSFINSSTMDKLMKDNILSCRDEFKDKDFKVVFHHSLNPEIYLKAHNAQKTHLKNHQIFAEWLTKNNINYVDISGSAENLMNFYNEVDLHIGYRVHAHIYMNSISKFSILLAEDGRAKAVRRVIGGIVLDGVVKFKDDLTYKIAGRLNLLDRYVANKNLSNEILNNFKYEERIGKKRIHQSRGKIDSNYEVMKNFISQLP